MIRRVSMIVLAISLTACVAVCALWARSEWEIDQVFSQAANGPAWWIKSMAGRCRLCWVERSDGTDQFLWTCYPLPAFKPLDWEYPNGWEYREYLPTFASSWEHLGIRYARGNAEWLFRTWRLPPHYWEFAVPYPDAAGLFAAMPLLALIHRAGGAIMRRRRRTRQHCQT